MRMCERESKWVSTFTTRYPYVFFPCVCVLCQTIVEMLLCLFQTVFGSDVRAAKRKIKCVYIIACVCVREREREKKRDRLMNCAGNKSVNWLP